MQDTRGAERKTLKISEECHKNTPSRYYISEGGKRMFDNINDNKSKYEEYSVEELQRAFRSIFLSSGEFSDADIEEMDRILAVLKRKRPVPRKYSTEESWKLFLETYSEEFARIGIFIEPSGA